MQEQAGTVTLLGSGEFGETMARMYRALLSRLEPPVHAVFVDTPAGFEINADNISAKAVAYFQRHLRVCLSVASWKSRDRTNPAETETALRTLDAAAVILAGPGSPTYAVRQWRGSPIWQAITERLSHGAHLILASAAAIAAGRYALPVYEIYKAGHDLHWTDGLDLLGSRSLNLTIVPHWNNAEGAGFDTRFCFMGQARFEALERLLPSDTVVLGIDEHTAVTLDLSAQDCAVQGVGTVTVRHAGRESVYESGSRFPLSELR